MAHLSRVRMRDKAEALLKQRPHHQPDIVGGHVPASPCVDLEPLRLRLDGRDLEPWIDLLRQYSEAKQRK